MVKDGDYVAIFHSIHRVMKAEQILKRGGVEMLLIPVPRQLSSDCGLAIRFAEGDLARVGELLGAAGLPPAELYRRARDDFFPLEVAQVFP